MSHNRFILALLSFCLIGCDNAGDLGAEGSNPYDTVAAPPPQAPAAQPRRAAGSPQAEPRRPEPTPPNAPPTPSMRVEDAGAHAVTLKFSEYAHMTRTATEMLEELTKIHIAVDESGDAGPYQERWGQLTAELAKLYTRVLAIGYPPADIVERLNEKTLPQLKTALDTTERAMQRHSFVESGIDRSFADAKAIYEHMSHNLSANGSASAE